MKTHYHSHSFLLILSSFGLLSFGSISLAESPRPMAVRYPAYQLIASTAFTGASGSRDVSMIAAVPNVKKGSPSASFGLRFNGNAREISRTPFLELREQPSNALIRTITVGEYLGIEGTNWKRVFASSGSAPLQEVTSFRFSASGQTFIMTRTIEVSDDEALPMGALLATTLSLTAERATRVSVRLLAHLTGGYSYETNSLLLGDSLELEKSASLLVMTVDSENAIRLQSSGGHQNGSVSIASARPVVLASGKEMNVMRLSFAGTTVSGGGNALRQARNILEYCKNRSKRPEVIATTRVNDDTPQSGDTVKYVF